MKAPATRRTSVSTGRVRLRECVTRFSHRYRVRYRFFTSLQGALPVFHIVTGFSTRYRFLMYLIGKFVTDVFTSLPVSQSVTRPVTGFTNSIGRAVPRVKILLVHLAKKP